LVEGPGHRDDGHADGYGHDQDHAHHQRNDVPWQSMHSQSPPSMLRDGVLLSRETASGAGVRTCG